MTETVAPPPLIPLAARAVLSRVVAVVTGKGGIGKTSTICALAAAAARYLGLKVLVVDMDPQGTTTKIEFGLGDTDHDDSGEAFGDALLTTFAKGRPFTPPIVEGVKSYPSGGRVDLVPGGPEVGEAVEAISIRSFQKSQPTNGVLALTLSSVASGYDLILIDNDPGDRTSRLMVLTAARATYAPIDYDPAAYDEGLKILIKETAEARVDNQDLFFLGAVAWRLPASTIYAWRDTDKKGDAKKRGGRMVMMAEKINAILADDVFRAEAELMPGYPRIFDSMIRVAQGATADAREARTNIVDFLHDTHGDGGTEEEKVLEEIALAADYEALVNELIDAIIALEQSTKARAA